MCVCVRVCVCVCVHACVCMRVCGKGGQLEILTCSTCITHMQMHGDC